MDTNTPRFKAVLVEPSRLYQQMIGQLLHNNEFEVNYFYNAQDALIFLNENSVDIICSAHQLPDMNITEMCSRLRITNATQLTPIIILTSEENNSSLHEIVQAGVTETFQRTELAQLANYFADFIQSQLKKRSRYGRILYVEDSIAIAQITSDFLRSVGYTVEHCRSAEIAIETFQRSAFDLVLTDIILAGKMTGIMLLRELRKLPGRLSEIPLLAMSSYDDPRRKLDILQAGANDYLAKPVLNEELAIRVDNLITNRHLMDKVKQQREQLHELAMRDQLTGLYNRHYLMDIAPKILSQAVRQKYPVSIVIIDVDHFKKINDSQGHAKGDTVLAAISQLLREACREEDVAARFGGEEFVLILPFCAEVDAFKKAELMRMQIEQLKPEGIAVTASFGITSLYKSTNTNFISLFEAADKAVYFAKQNGRNRVEIMH